MLLPGGWYDNGRRRRGFSFRPVTGNLELALGEAAEGAASWPEAVTSSLALALASLGEEAVRREHVAGLCTADRRFLMLRLQIHLGRGAEWRHAACSACSEAFDFFLDLSALPVEASGPEFPFASVRLGKESHRFRLPTGADQEAIADVASDEEAGWELLRRCWVPGQKKTRWESLRKHGASAWERVEAALESVSPAVASEVAATCPACGKESRVSVDGREALRGGGDLLREIHQLAMHYHWSEADILELGRPRRHRYLALIDQARGMAR